MFSFLLPRYSFPSTIRSRTTLTIRERLAQMYSACCKVTTVDNTIKFSVIFIIAGRNTNIVYLCKKLWEPKKDITYFFTPYSQLFLEVINEHVVNIWNFFIHVQKY